MIIIPIEERIKQMFREFRYLTQGQVAHNCQIQDLNLDIPDSQNLCLSTVPC